MKLAKPELTVRAIVANGKDLQWHGHGVEEEVCAQHGLGNEEEKPSDADADIQASHSKLDEHGQRHE